MSTPAMRAKLLSSSSPRPAGPSGLSLALLVLRILADDPHDALPADHLALGAYVPDRRPDFHRFPPLLRYVDDPPARQVVRRELDRDAVAGKDLDEVHLHLPGYVREDLHRVVELDA